MGCKRCSSSNKLNGLSVRSKPPLDQGLCHSALNTPVGTKPGPKKPNWGGPLFHSDSPSSQVRASHAPPVRRSTPAPSPSCGNSVARRLKGVLSDSPNAGSAGLLHHLGAERQCTLNLGRYL